MCLRRFYKNCPTSEVRGLLLVHLGLYFNKHRLHLYLQCLNRVTLFSIRKQDNSTNISSPTVPMLRWKRDEKFGIMSILVNWVLSRRITKVRNHCRQSGFDEWGGDNKRSRTLLSTLVTVYVTCTQWIWTEQIRGFVSTSILPKCSLSWIGCRLSPL